MQDNEIIKALECCYTYFDCAVCPYEKICTGLNVLTENTLDLINRQKAEIERLQEEYKRLESSSLIFKGGVDYLVKKAVQEFAERLKDLLNFYDPKCKFVHIHIDNLVKEMTEQ